MHSEDDGEGRLFGTVYLRNRQPRGGRKATASKPRETRDAPFLTTLEPLRRPNEAPSVCQHAQSLVEQCR